MNGLVELPLRFEVSIERVDEHANRPCYICRRRRIRYRVQVRVQGIGNVDTTDARCLECWTGPAPLSTMAAMEPPPDAD